MKRFFIMFLMLLIIISMVFIGIGCKGNAATEETTEETAEESVEVDAIKVGFSMPFVEGCPYCFPYKAYLESEAEALGWEIVITDAKGDINTQSNQIRDMVASGIDGLMIMPVDAAGIVPVIKEIYEETGGELPILNSNTPTDPAQLDECLGFAGPDSYTEGKLVGTTWGDYILENNIESVNYCSLTGPAGYGISANRTGGFVDGLKEKGVFDRLNLLDLQPGDWSPDKGQTITENWITTYGDEMEMIYSHNDDMILGAILALQNAGLEKGKVLVSGIDGHPKMMEEIKNGWGWMTLFQSPAVDAKVSIDTMAKILAGEEIDYFNFMETPVVNVDTVDNYYETAVELWK